MKKIEKKIAKNGAPLYYVDGKRTSRTDAMYWQRQNEHESKRITRREAETVESEAALDWKTSEIAAEKRSLEVAAGHIEMVVARCQAEMKKAPVAPDYPNKRKSLIAHADNAAFYEKQIEQLTPALEDLQDRIEYLAEQYGFYYKKLQACTKKTA